MRLEETDSALALHDHIVRASVASYEHQGTRALPSWVLNGEATGDDPDIVLPDVRRVEEIANHVSELDLDRLERLRRLGFEVWVLVPLKEMGSAHSRLRGLADRIQAWWVEENHIRFGEPRFP